MVERAERATAVLGAERLAGVLDDGQPVSDGELAERLELTRVAEDVDEDERLRSGRDCGGDRRRVEVQRARIDVGEDRCRTLVQHAVGRRDEGERRRDRLVSGPETSEPDAEMEPGRAARHGRDERRPDAISHALARSGRSSARAQAARSGASRGRAPPRARPGRASRAEPVAGQDPGPDVGTCSSQWENFGSRPRDGREVGVLDRLRDRARDRRSRDRRPTGSASPRRRCRS